MNSEQILLSEPNILGNELKYLKECLRSNWISSSGKYIEEFEKKISDYTGAKYAVSCINGTSALHLSLKILGIKSGDEVIVPTLTFIAPINTLIYNNCYPIFIDADNFFNIDINKCIDFINKETFYKSDYTYNKKTKKKISAIICVHVWGNAINLDELVTICRKRNIKTIEDASESLGTWYKTGKFANKHSGTIGNIGCLSFNGNKIITCGGGGMILTNNQILANKAKYYSSQAKDDPIYSIHNDIGYNYRMSNIHAAIGLAQLENINIFLKAKLKIFNKYKKELNNINGISIYDTPDYAVNNHWLNVLKIDKKKYFKSRNQLIELFYKNNIQTKPVWYLNHKQKMFKKYQNYYIENSIKLLNNSLCLPSSSNLKSKQLKKIINILCKN